MNNIHLCLGELGLSKNEIDIYLASLSIGENPASILGKKIGINRSTAQYTCQTLVDKRVMSVLLKGNMFLYKAENPEKLKNIIKYEFGRLEKKSERLDGTISDIKDMMVNKKSELSIKSFNGVEGLIDILNDVLEEKQTIYATMKQEKDISKEFIEYSEKYYIPKRIQLGIDSYAIHTLDKDTLEYRGRYKELKRNVMYLPEGLFDFDTSMHICGDKVAFYSVKKNNVGGVVIENKGIKNTVFTTFKAAWEYARKLEINKENKNTELLS